MTRRKFPNAFLQSTIEIVIVLAAIFGYLFIISLINQAPYFQFIRKAYLSLYFPQYNLCYVGILGGIHIYIHVIFAIVMATGCIIIWRRFSPMRNNPTATASVFTACVILGLLLIVQSSHYVRLFSFNYKLIANKSLSEKNSLMFADIYQFANFCKKNLPGKHQGRLITNEDVSTTSLNDHFTLMYYLYPIRIQYHPRQKEETGVIEEGPPAPLDCLIFYKKKDAANFVPENFQIIARLNNENLIATKKHGP